MKWLVLVLNVLLLSGATFFWVRAVTYYQGHMGYGLISFAFIGAWLLTNLIALLVFWLDRRRSKKA